jgi:hypothetical protein
MGGHFLFVSVRGALCPVGVEGNQSGRRVLFRRRRLMTKEGNSAGNCSGYYGSCFLVFCFKIVDTVARMRIIGRTGI